ncbi:hypothetical protein NX029_26265 [Cytobacillus firmus]|nr:hypothetical protein [Cytobacillus firmus]
MVKMEFIKQLKETDDSRKIKLDMLRFGSYEDMGFRMFQAVEINEDVRLSIQASYGHYCTPRKTLDKDRYLNMELAVFYKGDFASVSAVTDNELIKKKFEEYYDGTVYSYVPVGLLEMLYQDLKK